MFWILFRPERIAYCEGPIVLRGSRKIRVSDGEHMLLPDSMRPEPMFTYSALYNTTHFSLLVAIGRRGILGKYSPCRSDLWLVLLNVSLRSEVLTVHLGCGTIASTSDVVIQARR